MLQKTITIAFIYTCVIFTSCDSLLNTPPLDQIPDDQWWKNKKQTIMMVNSTYEKLFDINDVAFGDCISDNAKHRDGNITNVGNGTYDTRNPHILGFWKYNSIAELNYVLEGLEKSKANISDEEYRQFRAQVRFIRAFVYYYMAFRFGDIPLITKTLTVQESRQTSRQDRAEVLAFILHELEEGVLKDIEVVPVTESGRVNKDVVNAFLARIHLYEKNYKKAIYYANALIETNRYELYNDYDGLFRPQSDGKNKEVIFERQYVQSLYTHVLNRNLSPASSVYTGWSNALILQSLVDEYECIEGHAFHDCESLGCKRVQERKDIESPSKRGEYEFRDPRLAATVMYPFWQWKVGDVIQSVYGVDDPESRDYVKKETHMSGYLVTKWVDLLGEFNDRTLAHKNMTIIRYADVLLMKAEALIEEGQNLEEAVALIKQVRDRAGMPTNIIVTNQGELREKLRHERRVETAFEGLRYFDIIRWRIAGQVKSGKTYGARLKAVNENMDNKFMEERFWDDKMYLFPVPQGAIDVNPNLEPNNNGW